MVGQTLLGEFQGLGACTGGKDGKVVFTEDVHEKIAYHGRILNHQKFQ